MSELSPQKVAARAILEHQFERIGLRYHDATASLWEMAEERREAEEMWRLAGFGDPPPFEPTVSRPRMAVSA